MDIVISHMTALHFMRNSRFAYRPASNCDLPCHAPTIDELRSAAAICPMLGKLKGPWGVLLANKDSSRSTKRLNVHVWSTALPKGALVQIAPGIRCVSPAFLPLLVSSRLKPREMDLLLSELMGLYAVCEKNPGGLAQRRRPLLTPDGLREFMDALEGSWGKKKVRAALKTAPALAASPQEAKLYLRATLSFARGGYNMGRVVLNEPQEIERLGIGAIIIRKPDLLFIGGKGGVCLDYMGSWHDNKTQVLRDTKRRNELLANGFTPYEIFKEQYDDLAYMDNLMLAIREDLEMPPVDESREEAARRRRARHQLWTVLDHIDMTSWTQRAELR